MKRNYLIVLPSGSSLRHEQVTAEQLLTKINNEDVKAFVKASAENDDMIGCYLSSDSDSYLIIRLA